MGKADEKKEKVKRLEEKLKAAKDDLKKTEIADKKKQTKAQNKKGILFDVYFRTLHAEEYKRHIESPEFDNFLTRDYERALFNLEPLEKNPAEETRDENNSGEESATDTPAADEKIFLEVPYDYRNIAKSMGAIWDKEDRKWYAPEGTDPEQIQRAVDEAQKQNSNS